MTNTPGTETKAPDPMTPLEKPKKKDGNPIFKAIFNVAAGGVAGFLGQFVLGPSSYLLGPAVAIGLHHIDAYEFVADKFMKLGAEAPSETPPPAPS